MIDSGWIKPANSFVVSLARHLNGISTVPLNGTTVAALL